mmetsp:Transcript_91391/g.295587  ORF Transcript_91391/g.295587 Transcript_91391/m.295587 type:complete len:347 (+) Transcript_91391:421-1461(+)
MEHQQALSEKSSKPPQMRTERPMLQPLPLLVRIHNVGHTRGAIPLQKCKGRQGITVLNSLLDIVVAPALAEKLALDSAEGVADNGEDLESWDERQCSLCMQDHEHGRIREAEDARPRPLVRPPLVKVCDLSLRREDFVPLPKPEKIVLDGHAVPVEIESYFRVPLQAHSKRCSAASIHAGGHKIQLDGGPDIELLSRGLARPGRRQVVGRKAELAGEKKGQDVAGDLGLVTHPRGAQSAQKARRRAATEMRGQPLGNVGSDIRGAQKVAEVSAQEHSHLPIPAAMGKAGVCLHVRHGEEALDHALHAVLFVLQAHSAAPPQALPEGARRVLGREGAGPKCRRCARA